MTDEDYMRLAVKEAEAAAGIDEMPVGAVIVCQNKVIARAHNYTEHLCDITAHAEMQALTSAQTTIGGKYLTDCTIYVTLEPCVMCAGALGWSQISRIVYGASDPKKGYSKLAPNCLHPKTTVTSGVLSSECLSLIQSFFKKKR